MWLDEKESSESERRYDEEEKVVLETVGDTSVGRGAGEGETVAQRVDDDTE